MKAEHVNPFIKASKEVITQMTNIEFKVGKPFLKKSPFNAKSVLILIGITGDLKGQAIIDIDKSTALKIVSGMMGGMPVAELDEIARSALSELGNMIMGNSATLLYNQGIKIDITPPSLMMGQSMSISTDHMQNICVPLEADNDRVEINIVVKE
ncbi:chemotaxis protein CheX [Caminicella sporogenes DSM 14501]|uniref:Chemotaxis protein CheX n=1 Tax=Caminicella sporogenes DSM 14501 TaxID=1121266 RepID=A0A1M6MSG9_9FIRM|nr:chemotaxis protein CheX [Caminicella sporogenes]RKD22520.1 chemotaxis protein CheC [Caminicella sporogenes]WIF94945.1 chemotaxis protein CheX [Caminicella sporogenes]SHJ86448.1 chemotaxis protein CheX [Caminicella sporogenes DSM 14501]